MAQAHPFLDGNGRTFLIIHDALCHRAGFSIDWMSVKPTAYLSALSSELHQPGEGLLDQFLDPFIQDVPDSPTLAVEPDTLKARWNAQASQHAVCGAVVDRSAQGVVQQSDDGAYVHWPFSVLA